MYLTAANIIHYLAERGLIAPAAVLDGDVVIVEAGRRNRNFLVLRQRDAGMFVKQNQRLEQAAKSGLALEAAFLALMNEPEFLPLARWTARAVDYDARRDALILDLWPELENLREHCDRKGSPLPTATAATLGRALADLHGATGRRAAERLGRRLNGEPPWILTFPRAGAARVSALSPANRQLQRCLGERPEFEAAFARLAADWPRGALIHGDMKWDNILIAADQIRLADWELANRGDPAWDLAGVLQSSLVFWIERAVDAAPDRALPLEALHPPAQAFLSAYESASLDGCGVPATVERLMAMTAARLVQSVYERSVAAEALSERARAMLQVSQNILREPRHTGTSLFGLDTDP